MIRINNLKDGQILYRVNQNVLGKFFISKYKFIVHGKTQWKIVDEQFQVIAWQDAGKYTLRGLSVSPLGAKRISLNESRRNHKSQINKIKLAKLTDE